MLILVGLHGRFGVIAIEIDTERLEPAFLRQYHSSSARWVLIQRFLDAKGPAYERILIADVNETFFQTDPFDIIGEPGDYEYCETWPGLACYRIQCRTKHDVCVLHVLPRSVCEVQKQHPGMTRTKQYTSTYRMFRAPRSHHIRRAAGPTNATELYPPTQDSSNTVNFCFLRLPGLVRNVHVHGRQEHRRK